VPLVADHPLEIRALEHPESRFAEMRLDLIHRPLALQRVLRLAKLFDERERNRAPGLRGALRAHGKRVRTPDQAGARRGGALCEAITEDTGKWDGEVYIDVYP
jgi:hypothetical protein